METSDPSRRQLLIERMNDLESKGMGCMGCAGTCCTYEANSMMLTPLEAIELMTYLLKENMATDELRKKLQETVAKYRLEAKPLKGRSYLRKTYTCPFFGHQELGCPLPRNIKPYGCLAFDSHHPELKASEHCFSENELLQERENAFPEESKWNEEIREKYGLWWEKAPIPNALLDLWGKLTF